jgi:hypothetical protein
MERGEAGYAEGLAQMISSGLKGFKDMADDGNELRRVIRRLTCAVTAALAPAAGKPGQA